MINPIASQELRPLSILKTEGEWEIIMKMISESGKKDLNSFVKTAVRKLNNDYNQNPNKFCRPGDKICKRPYIPAESYNKLKEIAKEMQKPVSTIVDIYIIQPMLNPKP